jgi:GTPase SAR1 family protein
MALKGRKPELIQKRLKMLVYGPAGVGKTTAAIQFPKPYLIDTERGAENESYVKALEAAHGVYMFTNDPDELISEVRTLISEKHPYRTLVIDPLTTIFWTRARPR